LQYDRNWALFDAGNKLITAREYPGLLDVQSRINNDQLEIILNGTVQVTTPCRLFFQNEQVPRPVLQQHGGRENDRVSFADQCPLLLISTSSLADLNSRMATPISMQNFRPNVVVDGCDAYAEDQWKIIHIGDVEFEVTQACVRCVLTTIDPVTKKKGKEPLKTLADYRRDPDGGVIFGVHLIPRRLGSVNGW